MTASVSSTSHPIPVTLEQGLSIVQVNGWVTPTNLERVQKDVLAGNAEADARLLLVRLLETNLITKEQGAEFKTLILHQSTLPQFQFLKKIGAGGMGTVFLVCDHASNDRQLALKTINARLQGYEDFAGRFQRETTVLTGLNHPNIAAVLASGESHGMCYMAMEYIDGPSWFGLLGEAKVLPEAYVLNIAMQVAEGLAYVWQNAKLVHRDIKPENVLVIRTKDSLDPYPATDVAKLIDFGLVKPSRDADEMRLTQTGMTIGTPLYMSPEQIRGEDLDCRSDIYGLAATMYHLLTGTTPFAGNSPGEIMSAHLTKAAPDPGERVPSLHPSTRRLIMTGMAKKIVDRFDDHHAFIAAIQKVLGEITSRQGTAPKLLRKPMVLKGPAKKHQAEAANTPPIAMPDVGKANEPVSARIVHKHQHPETIGSTSSQAMVMPAMGDTNQTSRKSTSASPKASASETLRKVQTDRIGKLKNSVRQAISRQDGFSPTDDLSPLSPTQQPSSSIFHEDPRRSVGIGMTPWVVLASAALLLLTYLLLPI